MRTAAQIQADLTLVQTALTNIASGEVSSYSVGGKEFTLQNISTLQTREAELLKQLAAVSRSPTAFRSRRL